MATPIKPMKVPGFWTEGYVLDYHTERSEFVGHDEYGHPRFNTVRTAVGDLLYRLKYKGQKAALADIVATAASFIRAWNPPISAIVPVPPSRPRAAQPVKLIAQGLGTELRLPLCDIVTKRATKELKDVFDYHERMVLLANAYAIRPAPALDSTAVLLIDDLYRSGATLNAVAGALVAQGRVGAVYAFCLTRTRSSS